MIDLLMQIAAPIATIVAAAITAGAALKVRKQADRSESLNRENQKRLGEYQKGLIEINHLLSVSARQAQERYSLKAQALVQASRLAGEVCYYLERFLTPYTVHQALPRKELITKAEASFEALMKFHWENRLFFRKNGKVTKALSQMMGAINVIRNAEPMDGSFSEEQAKQFLATVTPAFNVIREEFSEELRRVGV